jgi:shikimate kinase
MNPESRRALGEFADVVWLDVPFGLAAARIEAQGRHTRPLASGDDWEHKLAALYARRAPLYASAAAWAVDGRGCPEEVAGRITALLEAGAGRRNE